MTNYFSSGLKTGEREVAIAIQKDRNRRIQEMTSRQRRVKQLADKAIF